MKNMKEYEERRGKIKRRNMKKYVGNMKEYPLLFGLLDLKKF